MTNDGNILRNILYSSLEKIILPVIFFISFVIRWTLTCLTYCTVTLAQVSIIKRSLIGLSIKLFLCLSSLAG